MYKCLVVDDEELARELIEVYVSQVNDFEVVASCSNALEAQKMLQTHSIDLVFLDIEMPMLKGTDFLKNLSNPPKVIFTTAYRDYAVEGFAVDATDYLVKPFSFDRFVQGVNKAIDRIKSTASPSPDFIAKTSNQSPPPQDHFFVKTNYKMEKIAFSNLKYIESMREYIAIFTTDQRFVVSHTMNTMEEKLPAPQFMRVHRSYIVSLHHIQSINGNQIIIEDKKIPIGASYRKKFFDQIHLL